MIKERKELGREGGAGRGVLVVSDPLGRCRHDVSSKTGNCSYNVLRIITTTRDPHVTNQLTWDSFGLILRPSASSLLAFFSLSVCFLGNQISLKIVSDIHKKSSWYIMISYLE